MNSLTLAERCCPIEILVLDVDGVLTEGRIVYSEQGGEIKAFHVRDGSGIKLWLGQGKHAALLSGRTSIVVERRGLELGITAIVQGADDKVPAFEALLQEHGLKPEQAAYVGDDLPDVPVMKRAGLAVAVADACAEAQAAAHQVTRTPGGQGAVREVIELILGHQGRWQGIVARYCG